MNIDEKRKAVENLFRDFCKNEHGNEYWKHALSVYLPDSLVLDIFNKSEALEADLINQIFNRLHNSMKDKLEQDLQNLNEDCLRLKGLNAEYAKRFKEILKEEEDTVDQIYKKWYDGFSSKVKAPIEKAEEEVDSLQRKFKELESKIDTLNKHDFIQANKIIDSIERLKNVDLTHLSKIVKALTMNDVNEQ